jgi:ABC-2 type transport system permease protein
VILLLIRLIRAVASAPGSRRAPARPDDPDGPGRGPLALIAHQARYDLLGILRDRQARFFTMMLPLIFLVIFVGIFGNNRVGPEHVKASTYYVPGLTAMAVIAGSFVNLVISVTAQREAGVLKRRRATPVPAWVIIAGRAVTAIAVSAAVSVVLLAVGRAAYGVHLPSSTLPAVAVTIVAGSAAFCVLGYALTTAIGSADAAQPTTQAVMLPLYFISGVFIPNPNLPGWLQDVARVFPVQHLAAALHHAFDPSVHGAGFVWGDLGMLAAWAAVGLAVALRRFAWAPAAAPA